MCVPLNHSHFVTESIVPLASATGLCQLPRKSSWLRSRIPNSSRSTSLSPMPGTCNTNSMNSMNSSGLAEWKLRLKRLQLQHPQPLAVLQKFQVDAEFYWEFCSEFCQVHYKCRKQVCDPQAKTERSQSPGLGQTHMLSFVGRLQADGQLHQQNSGESWQIGKALFIALSCSFEHWSSFCT